MPCNAEVSIMDKEGKMTIEQLERDVSLKLSLFSTSMAQVYLHLVLGNDKDSLHHLLIGKGTLDDALDQIVEETKGMFVPHGDKKVANKVRVLRGRITSMQKVIKTLMDQMGII
ncbi:MAG: hypothetical protein QMD77_01925 [Patescibacteria group bacterium]|nr:hypothetical protein [Patescibacteria group bacterium]